MSMNRKWISMVTLISLLGFICTLIYLPQYIQYRKELDQYKTRVSSIQKSVEPHRRAMKAYYSYLTAKRIEIDKLNLSRNEREKRFLAESVLAEDALERVKSSGYKVEFQVGR